MILIANSNILSTSGKHESSCNVFHREIRHFSCDFFRDDSKLAVTLPLTLQIIDLVPLSCTLWNFEGGWFVFVLKGLREARDNTAVVLVLCFVLLHVSTWSEGKHSLL